MVGGALAQEAQRGLHAQIGKDPLLSWVMPLAIELRPACPIDALPLAELASRTFQETFEGLYPEEDLQAFLASAYGENHQARELGDPAWRTFVLEAQGRLLGFAQLVLDCPLAGKVPDGAAELRRIYVLREALGQGLGARLLERVLEAAKAEGAPALWLGVWEHNDRAQAFYRKYGFSRVGEHTFMVGTRADTDHLLARAL